MFCHRDYLVVTTPPEDIDFDEPATMQGVVDKWTSLYAATSDKHDEAAFEKLDPKDRISARGSRSAIFSTSEPNTPLP